MSNSDSVALSAGHALSVCVCVCRLVWFTVDLLFVAANVCSYILYYMFGSESLISTAKAADL